MDTSSVVDMVDTSSIAQEMTPPPLKSRSSAVKALIIRVLTLVCLLISVTVTSSNMLQLKVNGIDSDFYAPTTGYMLAIGILGILYTILQIAFTIYFMRTGTKLGGRGWRLFEFFADKALSYLLATSMPTAFAPIAFAPPNNGNGSDFNDFRGRATATGVILFFGSIFSVVSSIFSSFSLPKKA